jgi:hypothetical protein
MNADRARRISIAAREAMSAEAMVLVYEASANLGRRAVIDALASVLQSVGDPLEKLWIEDASAGRHTYDSSEKLPLQGDQSRFRYLWAIPRSERRNSKSRWLTAAMIDNVAVDTSILFFALPRGAAMEFTTHRMLLELLVREGMIPRYGYGSVCQYDKPGHFAFDYAYNNRVPSVAHADWARACALSGDRGDTRVRAPILDVFPLNVVSDVHLRQKIGQSSFKDWIVQTTGLNSLKQIGPGCSVWSVPALRIPQVATQLRALGLTIDRKPQPALLPEPASADSVQRVLTPAIVCAGPIRCDPAPARFHNRMVPTAARPARPLRHEGAPAAIDRTSPASLWRRPGSH